MTPGEDGKNKHDDSETKMDTYDNADGNNNGKGAVTANANKNQHLRLELPAVIACGYRQIQSTKSKLSFPAFLTALRGDATGDAACDVRLVWRSKKDWLLLSRKSKKAALPKAALKKLAALPGTSDQSHNLATVPWRRPINPPKETDDTLENVILRLLEEMDLPSSPNRFRPEMKKSVQQVDQFLEIVQKEAEDSNYHDRSGYNSGVVAAWDVFCRPGDAEGLIEPQAANATAPMPSSVESSRLGQYFACETNARHVVKSVLRLLHERMTKTGGSDISHNSRPTPLHAVFVEPSCGNGDILIALIETFEQQQSQKIFEVIEFVSIFAYDIDPNVVSVCKRRAESLASQRTTSSSRYRRMEFFCSDFLKSSKPPDIDADAIVCCIGGPPYTTGAGSNSIGNAETEITPVRIERDLPTRFVRHCQTEWRADVISFLLPDRYKEMDWNGGFGASDHRDESFTPTDQKWLCETEELTSSMFFFRGDVEVKQPSILQHFYRINRGGGG